MMARVIIRLLIIISCLCTRAAYAENPYNVLGVPEGCSMEEANAAWRNKSTRAHPDMGGSKEAQQRLNDAISTIKRGIKTPSSGNLPGPTAWRPWRLLRRAGKLVNPIEAALSVAAIGAQHDQGLKAKILDGLDHESQMNSWQKWQMAEFARSHGYPIDTLAQRRQLADSWEVPLGSVYNLSNWDSIVLGIDSNYLMRFEEIEDGSQFKDLKFRRHATPSEFLQNEGISSFYSSDFLCKDREMFGPGFVTDPRNRGFEDNWYRVFPNDPGLNRKKQEFMNEQERLQRAMQAALEEMRRMQPQPQRPNYWWEARG